MKTRLGFVSNSSSSSFMVKKSDLTDLQKDLIINHQEEASKYGLGYSNWGWHITETSDSLRGYTDMDNFDMECFMRRIGVDISKVKIGSCDYRWEDRDYEEDC